MRLLITGLSGTLGPKVAHAAEQGGATILGWDRNHVPPDDDAAAHAYLRATEPDAIVHLALGSETWAATLAAHAATHHLPLVYTSTAMVFHHDPDGPHHPHDERTAHDDYGRYKIRCEDAIRAAHPAATIARIGWQIDPDATGNNMLAHLDSWQRQQGRVEASRAWRPACSFMEDTANALWRLIREPREGVVHLDSNAVGGYTFDQVARALAERFGRDWTVVVNEEYRHDQRLVGDEGRMPGIEERLSGVRAG